LRPGEAAVTRSQLKGQMASFLVVYDPTKGKEHEVVVALHRWGATRLFRGAWVIEFDSTADLARRALIAVGGAIAPVGG